MLLPQYQTKMTRFFELAFQQTQIAAADYGDILDRGQLQLAGADALVQNLSETFAQTALWMAANDTPFNATMSTQTYQMTTALEVFYALLDVWQIDNNGGLHDATKNANQNITIQGTGGPIPLSQTLDPTNANYMHWYDPGIMAACGEDPHVISMKGNQLFYVLIGRFTGCNGTTAGQLTAADYTDWKPITVRQPMGPEKTTLFYDLATLHSQGHSTLVLNRPYVGFFTTPAFFANWPTNASNEMRVTINQTFIVSTGTQVDGTDTMTPTMTPGLDSTHANQQACVYCHQTLDPSRSIFAATYSWNYGSQLDPTWSSQKGLFAFRDVQAVTNTMYDLGKTLQTHPLFASAWVQKLCYYVNSQGCDPTDPELTRLVTLFANSGSFSWNTLVKAVVTSPVTTHTTSTVTATNIGEAVAVSRIDHLCAMWNARLGFADICGVNATDKSPLSASTQKIIPGLPSDGYSRGGTIPVLPNDPSLFYRAAIENMCAGIAGLVIDPTNPVAGVKTWPSTQPTAAISDFTTIVAGLPATDPRIERDSDRADVALHRRLGPTGHQRQLRIEVDLHGGVHVAQRYRHRTLRRMPMIFTRRQALLNTMFGAGMVGLRALATGLPAAFFINPRKALADACANPSKAQYVIFSTSAGGDPINAGAPGTYADPKIIHSPVSGMAAAPLTLAGKSYTAAGPWSARCPQNVLDRTVFWHLMTNTPIHPKEPDVLKLMGATADREMLPSLIAKATAPCLNTIRAQPVSVGGIGPSGSRSRTTAR